MPCLVLNSSCTINKRIFLLLHSKSSSYFHYHQVANSFSCLFIFDPRSCPSQLFFYGRGNHPGSLVRAAILFGVPHLPALIAMERENKSDQHTSKVKFGDHPPPPHNNKTPTPKPSTTQTHDHVRDTRNVKTDKPIPATAHSIPPASPRNPPSDYQKAGPAFPHSVAHYPGGWSRSTLTGLTSSAVPQPFAQQVPGLTPQVQASGSLYQQFPSSTSYPYFYQPVSTFTSCRTPSPT